MICRKRGDVIFSLRFKRLRQVRLFVYFESNRTQTYPSDSCEELQFAPHTLHIKAFNCLVKRHKEVSCVLGTKDEWRAKLQNILE